MSKSISSYGSKTAKKVVVRRRLAQSEANRGLGYWGAKDAQKFIAEESANDTRPVGAVPTDED
jgi:hypothetical protein